MRRWEELLPYGSLRGLGTVLTAECNSDASDRCLPLKEVSWLHVPRPPLVASFAPSCFPYRPVGWLSQNGFMYGGRRLSDLDPYRFQSGAHWKQFCFVLIAVIIRTTIYSPSSDHLHGIIAQTICLAHPQSVSLPVLITRKRNQPNPTSGS
jgi:hypothetical protein